MRWLSLSLLFLSFASTADDRWAFYVGQHYRFGDEVNADVPFKANDDAARATSLQIWGPDAASTNWLVYISQFDNAIDGATTGDFQIRHAQLGGTKSIDADALTPFVGATVGAAQIATEVETQTRWAFTLDAGFRWQATTHMSVIADVRWLGILFNSATSIACDDNNCRLQFASGAWSQYEVGLALGVRF